MTTVDVLIVSHNTRDLLRDCLRSLSEHAPTGADVDLRVSVLDNASADGSADMVAAEFASVRLLRSSENLGFGAANNRLAATSDAEYLVLLNPDTVLVQDIVTPLLRALEDDPRLALAGPRLVYPDGAPQGSSEGLPTLGFEFAREIRGTKLQPLLKPVFDVEDVLARMRRWALIDARRTHDAEFLWATCWLLRRADFPGGAIFDPGFPLYDEDLDLCRRLHDAGRRVRYVADAELVHLGGRSSTSARKQELMRSGRARYYRRHEGRGAELAYRGCVGAVDLVKRGLGWVRPPATALALVVLALALMTAVGCGGAGARPAVEGQTAAQKPPRPVRADAFTRKFSKRVHTGMALVLDRMAGRRGGNSARSYAGGVWTGAPGCWRCLTSAASAAGALARYEGPKSRWLPVAEATADRMIADHRAADGSFGPGIGAEHDNPQISTMFAGLTLAQTYLELEPYLDNARRKRWRSAVSGAAAWMIPRLDFYVNGNINLGDTTFLYLAWRVTGKQRFLDAYHRSMRFTLHPTGKWKAFGLRYFRRPKRADGADGSGYLGEAIFGGTPGFDTNYAMVQADHAALLYAASHSAESKRLLNLLVNGLVERADKQRWSIHAENGSRHPGTVSVIMLVTPAVAIDALAAGRKGLRKYVGSQFHASLINFLQQMDHLYTGENRSTEYASLLFALQGRARSK